MDMCVEFFLMIHKPINQIKQKAALKILRAATNNTLHINIYLLSKAPNIALGALLL